jgi:4-amino-4-deoxy-L-arabinose transferase-like glycosyltransferase
MIYEACRFSRKKTQSVSKNLEKCRNESFAIIMAKHTRIVLLVLILSLALLGQNMTASNPGNLVPGLLVTAFSVFCFVIFLIWVREGDRPGGHLSVLTQFFTRIESLPPAAPLLLASLLIGAGAVYLDTDAARRPWWPMAVWALSVILFLGAALTLRASNPAQHETGDLPSARIMSITRAEFVLLGLLFAVALALRSVALDDIPRVMTGDEGSMGMMAREVAQGKWRNIFATAWLGHPSLWFFVQAASISVFGDSLGGLRAISALIGAATVPALYFLMRSAFGKTPALLAAALLAIYHLHIHYSRLALNNISDALFVLLVFGYFFHGVRDRSAFGLAMAGVIAGLAQHFYPGSRLTPILLAVVCAHQMIFNRRQLFANGWRLALTPLGFVLAFGPLLRFFVQNPNDFNARISQVGIFQTGWYASKLAEGLTPLDVFLSQARAAFGAYTFVNDRSAFYMPLEMPLLDNVSSVLFLIGVVILIMRLRHNESALMLIWLVGVSVFGGLLLVNPPESTRFINAAPAICAALAIGVHEILTLVAALLSEKDPARRSIIPAGGAALLSEKDPARRPTILAGGAALLSEKDPARRSTFLAGGAALSAVALAAINLNFYFLDFTPRSNLGGLNTEVGHRLGVLLRNRPRETQVYFFTRGRMGYDSIRSVAFISQGIEGINVNQPIQSVNDLPQLPPGKQPLFIFMPEALSDLQVIQAAHPDGATREEIALGEKGQKLFTLYEPR